MNEEQWLFEYTALKARERDEAKAQMDLLRVGRNTLISLLGLNVLGDLTEDEKRRAADPTLPRFVPLAFMVAPPEVTKHWVDIATREEGIKEGVDDEDFDALSRELQQHLAGEVRSSNPLVQILALSPEEVEERTRAGRAAAYAEQLRALGMIKPEAPVAGVDVLIQDGPTAPHIDPAEIEAYRRALSGEDDHGSGSV